MAGKHIVPNNLENCTANGHSPELDDDMVRKLFTCSGTNCTNLKMVYSLDEFRSGICKRSFKPEMVHQVYGFSEMIYGYKDLKVDLYFLANSAKCFINISYSEIINVKDGHPSPDRIYNSLSSWLPEGYTMDKTQFASHIRDEDYTKLYGTVIDKFEAFNKKDNEPHTYVISECSINELGFPEFHERFQCFLVWFIDAASQIDMSDPNWMFFYIYEQRHTTRNRVMSYPVGFCTVYKFYNFPDKIRTRISQLFIMPSCQRIGLGTRLLKATYNIIYTLPNVTDITVEDPCPEFVKMRDLLDCRLLAQLESFNPSTLKNGFKEFMFMEANTHFKINKRQCRRLYEIFRVHNYQSLKEFTEICGEIEKNFRNIYVNCRKLSRKLFANKSDKNEDSNIVNSIRDKDDLKEQMESYFKDIQAVAIRLRKRE